MITSTYAVAGMSCSHCVKAVSTEMAKLPGVSNVEVDLVSGEVSVASAESPATDDIAAAVERAGYELEAQPETTS